MISEMVTEILKPVSDIVLLAVPGWVYVAALMIQAIGQGMQAFGQRPDRTYQDKFLEQMVERYRSIRAHSTGMIDGIARSYGEITRVSDPLREVRTNLKKRLSNGS